MSVDYIELKTGVNMRCGRSALVIGILFLFVPWTTAAGAQTLYDAIWKFGFRG